MGSLGVVADGPVGGSGVWEWEGVGRTLARHFSGTPRAGNAGNGLGASGDDEAQGGHLDPLGEKEALAGLPETSVLPLVLPETCCEALGKPRNPCLGLSERTSRDFWLKGSETVNC